MCRCDYSRHLGAGPTPCTISKRVTRCYAQLEPTRRQSDIFYASPRVGHYRSLIPSSFQGESSDLILVYSTQVDQQEYMNNIQVVDNIVHDTEKLFLDFYGDEETTFVFTADHGMSKIGNHEDGGEALSLPSKLGLHHLFQTRLILEHCLLCGAKAFEALFPIPHLLCMTTSCSHGSWSMYSAEMSLKWILLLSWHHSLA